MTNLSIFQFESHEVRFVGTAENPEWIAADVCAVLDLKGAPAQHLRRLRENQKGVISIHTPGGNQEMATVTEAGLYSLIFKSRKKVAERFQDWVFEEVLPSIRKTGSYSTTPKPPTSQLPQRDAIEYLTAIERLPNLTNPILRSALEQRFAEELTATRVLPGSSDDDLVLVSVLAREMGYSLAPNEDARLGKWVRRHHEPTGQAQHGRYSVNVYRRSEIIDTVRAFFR